MEIQNDYVKLILMVLLKLIRRKDASDAIEYMEDLGITNEILKEHLLYLCMDDKITQSFEDLDSSVKAAFTREYNKQHKDDFTGKKAPTKKGMKAAKEAANEDEDEDQTVDDGPALMTEEQKLEVKQGKKKLKEEEEKEEREKSKAENFEMLQLQSSATAKKGKKGVATAKKGPAAKKGAKKSSGKKKRGRSDDEDLESDDSLNDFIADDDEDIEYEKKKKKRSAKKK